MKFELPEASTILENSEKNFGHMSCGFEPPTLGSKILHLTNESKLMLNQYFVPILYNSVDLIRLLL